MSLKHLTFSSLFSTSTCTVQLNLKNKKLSTSQHLLGQKLNGIFYLFIYLVKIAYKAVILANQLP